MYFCPFVALCYLVKHQESCVPHIEAYASFQDCPRTIGIAGDRKFRCISGRNQSYPTETGNGKFGWDEWVIDHFGNKGGADRQVSSRIQTVSAGRRDGQIRWPGDREAALDHPSSRSYPQDDYYERLMRRSRVMLQQASWRDDPSFIVPYVTYNVPSRRSRGSERIRLS